MRYISWLINNDFIQSITPIYMYIEVMMSCNITIMHARIPVLLMTPTLFSEGRHVPSPPSTADDETSLRSCLELIPPLVSFDQAYPCTVHKMSNVLLVGLVFESLWVGFLLPLEEPVSST